MSNFPNTICWRQSFPHCVFSAPLSKVSWPYLHGFISGLSILFHWSVCLLLLLFWRNSYLLSQLRRKIGAVTVEKNMEVSQKIKVELPYDLAILLLGIYLKKNKNTNSKRHMHPNVHISIICNSQDMEAT